MLKQSGQIFLWRYKDNVRNYPGWHLCADSQGCEFLLEVLNAFNKSQEKSFLVAISNPPSKVLSVPNNQGGRAKWQSPKELKLSFDSDANATELWDFSFNNNLSILKFGSKGIKELKKGIQDVTNGQGDYSIGGYDSESNEESTCLWFWWYPKKL